MHSMQDDCICKFAFLHVRRHDLGWWRAVTATCRCLKMGLAQSALVSSIDFQEAIAAGKRMAKEAVMTPSPGSRKETTYFSFKSDFQLESYILKVKNQHLRRIIAKFSTRQHELRVQTGRYDGPNILNVSANGVHQASMMRIMPSLHAPLTSISERDMHTFSAALIMTSRCF